MCQVVLPFLSVSLRDFYHSASTTMIQQENLKKRLARLAAPIFIETLLIMMLGAVDTVMLSRHSDNSVAAVGVVNQIIMLTFLVFEVINLGTSVLCSQYLGARLHKQVVQVVGVSLLVNFAVGVGISMLLFGCAEPILRLMGLGPELMQDGMDYMRIVGAFAFFQALSLTLSASLRSANKAVYPMLVTVVVNVLNIIGNYSLIFGRFGFPELGVEGAAISTAFSRGVSMVILFVILFRKHIHRFPPAYFRPFPWVELKNLMKVGLPSAGEQLSYSSSQVVITYFINMLGVEALATRTYCVNIIMFAYLFSISMAQGGAICIGHLIGEKKPRAAFLMGKYVMKKSVMITVILSCILALFGHVIFGWLTSNAEIIKMGGYHSGYRYCAGDRASCQYLRDECAACGRRCELSVLCRAGGDVECSRRTWLSVRHSVGLGHLRHVGSVFAGRKYPRGYFCAPLVQHEMGKQEFYKIMLGEESPVFFMGSKRCVPVKIGKLNGDTLKGV